MTAPVLAGFAEALGDDGIGCLRFNFLYKERGKKAPDREPLLRGAWEAAFEQGRTLGEPVWVAGKSLGGRIASLLVADGMPAAGIVFLGYPLHAPGKPERLRDEHLARAQVPMLFLQGDKDPFARWELLEPIVKRLGERAMLHRIPGGDHSFRVRGGPRDDHAIGKELGGIAAGFIGSKG